MDIERAYTILTEEIEDHLPEEKWKDYEDALTEILKIIKLKDETIQLYRNATESMTKTLLNQGKRYADDPLAYTD